MMNVKGIIFDLDGTLVDSIEDISTAANLMLRSNGFPEHTVEDYLRWIGNGAARVVAAALPEETGQDTLYNLVREFKVNYGKNLHEKTRLYDGIPEMLDLLTYRQYELSVLSNKPHLLTLDVANYYLKEWPFSYVFGQRDHIPRKPDPSAAIEIAKYMDIDPGEIIFIGDSKNDVITARSGGFIPVGVSWGYGSVEDLIQNGASYIIDNPSELIDIIKK